MTAPAPVARPGTEVLRVSRDGQYEIAFPAVDHARAVAGVRMQGAGVDAELQLVRWTLGRAGDVGRSATRERLRRPLVIPAGAAVVARVLVTRTEPAGVLLVSLDLAPSRRTS